MRRAPLFLLLWLAAAPARATEQCLLRFAGTAEQIADPTSLVRATYGELLDTLGVRLSLADYQKLVEKGDPFVLPEEARESLTLGKRLADFKGMLEKRGWNTPEIRKQLIDDARARAVGGEVAREKSEQMIRESFGDHLPFPMTVVMAQRPDGKMIGFPYDKEDRKNGYYLYDPATRQATLKTGNPVQYNHGFFSPDGKVLYVPKGKYLIDRVPVEGDELRFDLAKPMEPANNVNDWLTAYAFPRDPNVLYAGRSATTSVARFDLETGKPVRLQIGKYLKDENARVHEWGTVPGTDHFWMMASTGFPKEPELHVVSVAPDGKLTNVSTRKKLAPGAREIETTAFLPDGKGFLYSTSEKVFYSADATTPPKMILDTGSQEEYVSDVEPVPGAPTKIAVMRKVGKNRRIDVIDLATQEKDGFEISDGELYSDLTFSPDGNTIYLKLSVGDWRAINIRNRLNTN